MEEVTVCIPCYNSARTVRSTLESVLKQTHGAIRIIISDNASTDNSWAIVSEYQVRDSRVEAILQPHNIGYCGNVLFLVQRARTDYVAIYHADDLYHPKIIERSIQAARSRDLDFVFTYMRHFFHGHHSKVRRANYRFFEDRSGVVVLSNSKYQKLVAKYWNFFVTSSLLVRRDVFLDLGGFRPEYPSNEDLDLWLRAMARGFRFGIVAEYLIDYRRSAFNGSATFAGELRIPVFFDVLAAFCKAQGTNLGQKFKTDLSKARSLAYLELSSKLSKVGRTRESLSCRKISREEYAFPRLSFGGIAQSFPVILTLLGDIKNWLRN